GNRIELISADGCDLRAAQSDLQCCLGRNPVALAPADLVDLASLVVLDKNPLGIISIALRNRAVLAGSHRDQLGGGQAHHGSNRHGHNMIVTTTVLRDLTGRLILEINTLREVIRTLGNFAKLAGADRCNLSNGDVPRVCNRNRDQLALAIAINVYLAGLRVLNEHSLGEVIAS